MALSLSKSYLSKHAGLTLIEVLIALAIMSIAMIAVMKAVSQSVRASTYLQQKTIAAWLGQKTINEIHAGKAIADSTTPFLSQDWYLKLKKIDTPNSAIKEIEIRIFPNEATLSEETPILTLETYVYQPA